MRTRGCTPVIVCLIIGFALGLLVAHQFMKPEDPALSRARLLEIASTAQHVGRRRSGELAAWNRRYHLPQLPEPPRPELTAAQIEAVTANILAHRERKGCTEC